MKTKLRRISLSTISLILAMLIMVSIMGIGTLITVNSVSACNWQAKKLYFVAPDSWDISTYNKVQVDITRTTSATESNYQCYIATMTRVGSSRLYQATINADHSNWGRNEYIAFTANSSSYGNGTFTLNTNHYYTTPNNYGVNNSGNYYAAIPTSDANGCAVSMNWNSSRDTLMKKTQTANVYTNKSSSSTGGSVSLAGYYFTSDTAIATSSSSPSYDAVAGTTMTMTATANSGYTFDGWYSDSSCSTKLSSSSTYSYNVTGAKTVYANFTPNTHNVTRTAPSNGTLYVSTSSTVGTGTTATVAEGSTYYIKATPSAGYKLTALTVTPSGGSAVSVIGNNSGATSAVTVSRVMGSADENVAATFAKQTYTVSYNKGSYGSGTNTSDTKTYGEALTLKGAIFTRTGYTQTGWNTNSSGSGGTHYNLSASYTANAGTTLYPEWTPNTYTITYKDQGGSAFSGTHESGYPTTHTYGTATSLKSASKDGYTFGGWFTTSACTGSAVTSLGATSYTANITLYAKWTIKTYTITYNKGANGTGTIASGTKTHGVDFTLSSSTFTRADYTQTGWSTTDGGAKAYELGGTYTANSNITLYPFWTRSASPQLASISNVTGKTVNDTSFNATTTINNSQYASGTLTVTASSNSTSIITVGTVNKSGNNVTIPLTVKGPGTATITVTLKDGSTTVDTKIFTVTVDAPTFTINADTVYASTKDKALTVTKSPTPSSTTWASNKTSYVTVNSSGQVTTVAIPTSDQTVTITATATYACGYSTSFTGTVTLKAPTLTISSTKTSGYINDTATASVSSSANPSLQTSTLYAYNWTSSDSSVVSVSSATAASPTLTFLKNGTANITLEVTYKNTLLKKTSNSVTITVNAPTVTMADKTVAKGDSVTFSATTANPSSGLNISYSLKSAVSGVSINSSTGVVSVTSGCSASSATVVATVTNSAGATVATKEATLTIQAPTVTIADIANNSTQNLTVGTNITNKTVSNNFSGTYTVTSSKTSVATASITSGKLTVTSVAKGKTTITVTATKGSITASRTFTVLVAAPASTDHVIYFTDNVSWGSACIHAWGPDGGAAIADRAAMTKIGTNENNESVYAYKFTASDWANVQHIRFLKNSSANWNDGTQTFTDFSYSGFYKNGSYDISVTIPQISADDIDDLPITTSTSLYADVLNSTTPSKFKWSIEDTSIATVANADTGTTDHNSITGVYPGTTTITIKAYAALPTGWTSIVTDGTADAFLADSTTASVTVTATPKTVTWGNKLSTDNGSTFTTTNASSAGTVSVSPTMSNGGSVAHGTQITFTATTNSGYRFAGWQVNGTNTITTTTSKTITVTANTTVYALYYKTYTVTLSVGTGIQTGSGYRKYKVGSGGTYANYSSAVTVNQGAEVYFQIAYKNGYEYDSVTNASVVTNYTEFKTSAISADTTVSITAKKITYTLTGKVSPTGHGAVKFYSNSTCTSQINTAQIGDSIYARFEPSDAYVLQSFTKNSNSATFGTRSGNVIPITMGYMNLTVTANVILQYSVTYYIDMHSANVSSLTAKVTDSGGTVLTDSDGEDCEGTFTRQGSSTVYAATINTPLTQSGSTYNTLYFTITFNGSSYQKELNNAQITSMVNNSEQAIWLEAMSDSPQDLSIVYSTNQTPTVESGYQRIYLKKPYSWQNTTEGQKWTNIGVYYWGDNPTDIGWTKSIKMNYLGYDTSSGHHYYYADIPTTIHDTSDDQDYAVKNIIFQGWGSNESISQNSHVVAQTENIMNFTKNYFTLENTNNVITGVPAESNALVPGYTRYASSVTAQVGETETINIKPTTSNTVTFSSNGSQYASVDSNGNITPHAKGVATITITVYGTVGDLVRSHESTAKDYRKYYVNVYVKDPSVTSGFDIMSFSTRTSTITIPTVSGSQPGYFDSAPSVAVTGTPNAPTAGYPNSAIVSPSDNAVTGSGISGTKYKTYTVKYAAPSTFSGYTGITVTAAEIVSKSIHYNDEARYGFKQWKKGTTVQSYTVTKSVTDGVETAITKNVVLDGSTFSEEFEQYTYVDVTFNYDYYEYETLRTVDKLDAEGNRIPISYDQYGNPTAYETEQKNFYYYDPEWVGNETRTDSAFDVSKHKLKTYTVTDFEVRYKTADAISASNYDKNNLVGDVEDAIGNKPDNNYYDYTISDSTIKTITKNSTYKATVKVEMTHTPKTYRVFRNGTRQTGGSGANGNYYYQEYANLTNGTSLNWILTNSDSSYTGPTMYTGTAYKFRVTGDTYLKTAAGTISDADFNRSRVALTNQETKYEPKSQSNPTIVEKLTNNFYISDFFDPAKVLNDRNLPEDDVNFVGGGVVYYQIKDGVPAQKAVDGGYVDSSGVADADAVKEFIQEKIEAGLTNTTIVPNDIEGTDDRMAIAYGYEYKAQKDDDTDLFYRYLPYEVYNRTNGGTLETQTVDGVTSYTLATNRQSNAYRYSNALKAYQYIYASTQENKITNAGKNMCLYAYYIYSYTAYDSDTGIPYTKYNVVLSDQPANASTYFNSNS